MCSTIIKLARTPKNGDYYSYNNGVEYLLFTNRKKFITSITKHEKELNAKFAEKKRKIAEMIILLDRHKLHEIKKELEECELLLRHSRIQATNSIYFINKILLK